MDVLESLIERSKKLHKRIVLPEGMDERVLRAASNIHSLGIAIPIVIGNKQNILSFAASIGEDISEIEIIDPLSSEKYEEYVNLLFELRKEKGMTLETASNLVKDPVYYGVLMVKAGDADGLVSGAIHSTADTLRPALQIIKGKEGAKLVSSFFLMNIPNSDYNTTYIFSDCGLVPNPTGEELAIIAKESARTYKELIGGSPKVALLSYSTHGSAKSESTEKVLLAKSILEQEDVDFDLDGELQLDAAIDATVAVRKAKFESSVAGKANVLIFPNLDSGNIGYKLVEKFAHADAIGPITQGLAKPINDLSRGCKMQDVIVAVAITSIQC